MLCDMSHDKKIHLLCNKQSKLTKTTRHKPRLRNVCEFSGTPFGVAIVTDDAIGGIRPSRLLRQDVFYKWDIPVISPVFMHPVYQLSLHG